MLFLMNVFNESSAILFNFFRLGWFCPYRPDSKQRKNTDDDTDDNWEKKRLHLEERVHKNHLA